MQRNELHRIITVILFAAPHRSMFFGGVFQAIAAMLLWAIELGARATGAWPAPVWPLPAPWWHAMLMIFGVFPFFIFGFILTAGPRWQGVAETPRRVFAPAFTLMAAGWALVGLSVPLPSLLPGGLLLVIAGWTVALHWLWQVALLPARDRLHIRLAATAMSLGAAGLAAIAAFAAGAQPALATLGIALGLWGMLATMFFTVTHRMLPFFSSSALPGYVVYRADWTLVLLCAAAVGHGTLARLGFTQWTWCVDAPAAAVALHLTLRWNLRRSLGVRLLAVLHIAYAWSALAWLLFAADSLLLLLGRSGLGFAPLHALTLGYFASMLVGMASRVTLGHSGQPLAADTVMWGAFWAMQGVAVMRVAAEWLPGTVSFLTALLWLTAWAVWGARYAPHFWRPRADGKPG